MLLKFDGLLGVYRFGPRRFLGFVQQCQDRHEQFQAAMAAAFGRANFMRRTFIRKRYLNSDGVRATRDLNFKFGQEKNQLVGKAVAGESAEKYDQGSTR